MLARLEALEKIASEPTPANAPSPQISH